MIADIPYHVADLLSKLDNLDSEDLDDAIIGLYILSGIIGFKLGQGKRRRKTSYVNTLEFGPDLFPKKVFIKSNQNPVIASKYPILRTILQSPQLMQIYGSTKMWQILEYVSHKPLPESPILTPLGSYLLAVDQLAHIHSLDTDMLRNHVGFPYPYRPSALERFEHYFGRAKVMVGSDRDVDTDKWNEYLNTIDDGFEYLFPAIIQPQNDKPVLCHGEYMRSNIVFTPSNLGWMCKAVDWDICYLGSRWNDLAYLTIPTQDRAIPTYLIYDQGITRYCQRIGVYDNIRLKEFMKIFYQHKVLRCLIRLVRGQWQKSLGFKIHDAMGYYLEKLQ